MQLNLGIFEISQIEFGDTESIKQNTITLNKEKLVSFIKDIETQVMSIDFHLASPGDSIRITPVKDVIEPRCKVEGKGSVFAGLIQESDIQSGNGTTHVLKGMAVVTVGKIIGFQEGIIDMKGEGAKYTPFSKMVNLVTEIKLQDDNINPHSKEKIYRMVGLSLAHYIALISKDLKPDYVESYSFSTEKANTSLPSVGYVYMLQSQGLLHDTYVYGLDAKLMLPTIISPTEVMDGAIISGNCVSACDKNPTYVHQNNPVIHELFERDGKDINFAGIILTNENVILREKVRSSDYTAKLVKMFNWDGAIISQEGFGNPDADLIMNCEKLEDLGVKTVLLTDEYAGPNGDGQSLADVTQKAVSVVTNGNANQVVHLEPMDKVIGDISYVNVIAGGFDGSQKPDGSISIEIQAITGATNELGFHHLTATEY